MKTIKILGNRVRFLTDKDYNLCDSDIERLHYYISDGMCSGELTLDYENQDSEDDIVLNWEIIDYESMIVKMYVLLESTLELLPNNDLKTKIEQTIKDYEDNY